jgi:hypothetical protein
MAKPFKVFFLFSVFLFFQSPRAIGEGDGLPDVTSLAHMSVARHLNPGICSGGLFLQHLNPGIRRAACTQIPDRSRWTEKG